MSKVTKGLILAGGSGTRLYPMTTVASKQLQPVYDKPMIYYPLSTLMMAGIRDVMIISTPRDTPMISTLLGDGGRFGINIRYTVQQEPRGIAEAFIIARDFIGEDDITLMLGDNIFYGRMDFLRTAIESNQGATIFGYEVSDPERYGVVELDEDGSVLSIEEKPRSPRSNLAIPGLYVYDHTVCDISASLVPSNRGELEITDVHQAYLGKGQLNVVPLGRGIAWLDTGAPEAMLEASTFIHAIEKRQGVKIGCLEEIALRQGLLDRSGFERSVQAMPPSPYREYCERLLK